MTTFFLDLDGGSDVVLDSSPTPKALTLAANTVIVYTNPKFGGGSLDCTFGNACKVTTPDHADWEFGSGQFTVECHWRMYAVLVSTTIGVINHAAAGNYGWLIEVVSGVGGSPFTMYFRYSVDGTAIFNINAAWVPAINTWYHIAVDRDASNVIRMYVNGSVIASTTDGASFFDSTTVLTIGANNATNGIQGNMDAVRITKGVARYGGAFTPPSAAYPEGGSDSNWSSVGLLLNFDYGTSFASRWKTFALGPIASRTAPGDTFRIMASPPETLVGDVAWTQNSKTLTLPGAVTATICDCESVWTGSTNVTQTADVSVFKEGAKSAKSVIAAGFTTGKIAYFATGALDLSAYQQVSFWFRNTVALAAGAVELRLCSDTIGDTVVHTIAIGAILSTSSWSVHTIDLGANMSAAIASISLYANTDPGSNTINIDNVIACKASSAADALTLSSLLGKVWNKCWVASTTYATNDIRKPTQPNRNGYRYKVTAGGGGVAGSTEPAWPQEIGGTVTDGALTWTCEGLEDTWYGIQSISGTTVKLDNASITLGNAGRGYSGATETVATYKREATKQTMVAATTTGINIVQESGTPSAPYVYSGGWDRTDMSTQDGETWVDGQNGVGYGFDANTRTSLVFQNLNAVRCTSGLTLDGTHTKTENCQYSNNTYGILISALSLPVLRGVSTVNSGVDGISHTAGTLSLDMRQVSCNGNLAAGAATLASTSVDIRGAAIVAKNNGTYGINHLGYSPIQVSNLTTASNAVAGVNCVGSGSVFINASIAEATEFVALPTFASKYIFSQKHDGVADAHLITTDGGTIVSATDQRHTASGISWKFMPASTNRSVEYPMKLSMGVFPVNAGALVTYTIWVRRDSTDIKSEIWIPGGQLAGVPTDVIAAAEPSINTWAEYTVTFTPSEIGAVEVFMRCWDGVGTANSLWVDDHSISQA